MAAQFTDICFITEDVMGMRAFYEKVFGGKAQGDQWHSGLSLQGLSFTFDSLAMVKENESFGYVNSVGGNNVIIGFNVEDVDEEYRRLHALGVSMLSEPTTHPWGARSFQFRDPGGNILNFRSLPEAPAD